MKHHITCLLLAVLTLLFASCENILPEQVENPIHVGFNAVLPEITITDEPLTKAGNTLYYTVAIQQYNDNTKQYEAYAFGIFNSLDGAGIDMYASRKYNISISVLPFHPRYSNANGTFDVLNQYVMYRYWSLDSWTFNDTVFGDSYSGSVQDFSPTGDTCSVNLASEASGFRIEVSGMNEGKLIFKNTVSWNIYSISFDLAQTSTYESLVTFRSWVGHRQNSLSTDWSFVYESTSGEQTILKNLTVVFKKGQRKVFNVKFEGQPEQAESKSISVHYDQTSLSDEEGQEIIARL